MREHGISALIKCDLNGGNFFCAKVSVADAAIGCSRPPMYDTAQPLPLTASQSAQKARIQLRFQEITCLNYSYFIWQTTACACWRKGKSIRKVFNGKWVGMNWCAHEFDEL